MKCVDGDQNNHQVNLQLSFHQKPAGGRWVNKNKVKQSKSLTTNSVKYLVKYFTVAPVIDFHVKISMRKSYFPFNYTPK